MSSPVSDFCGAWSLDRVFDAATSAFGSAYTGTGCWWSTMRFLLATIAGPLFVRPVEVDDTLPIFGLSCRWVAAEEPVDGCTCWAVKRNSLFRGSSSESGDAMVLCAAQFPKLQLGGGFRQGDLK